MSVTLDKLSRVDVHAVDEKVMLKPEQNFQTVTEPSFFQQYKTQIIAAIALLLIIITIIVYLKMK